MSRVALRIGSGLLAALLLASLLPMTVLAASPTAVSDSVATNEDDAKVITLVGTDDDGDGLTFSITSGPSHGDLSGIGTPDCVGSPSTCSASVTYTPDVDYHGADDFTFDVTDGADTGSAIINVTVVSQNDGPVAVNDPTNPIVEDVTTTLNPLANDSDPEDDTLTITGTSGVTLGVVSIINAGTRLSYNPNTNATGNDSFTYTISDGTDTASATVTVQIGGVNDGPVAVNDPTNPIVEDVTTTLNPLANDSDPEDDTLTITGTSGVTLGVVSIINAGTRLSYNPNTNATGNDSFTYTISDGTDTASATVTVQISDVDDGPTAVDDEYEIEEDGGAQFFAVTQNDIDIDGPTLTVTGKSNPLHGVLTLTSGVLSYTPGADFHGTDSFNYTVSDGTSSDNGHVTITVNPVNDPPEAVGDTETMSEDPGPQVIAVLGNDDDIDGDTISVVSKTEPAHGTLTLAAGVLTYTPATNYFGPDAFTYTISDGALTASASVAITITSENDPPEAVDDSVTITRDTAANPVDVLTNDSDLDGDTRTITAKTNGGKGTVVITGGGTGLTYDPFTGFLGADSFTYTISDGHGGSDTATVTVNITGANRAPNAVADVSFSVPEGAAATELDVLANDDDPDGDTFTVAARTNGAHGITRITAGGNAVTYAPNALFDGTDSFTYTIRDAGGMLDTTTVVVTVTRDRTAPIVVAPAQRFLGQTVGTSTIKIRMTWSGSDPGSGIKSYQLQESRNGGTYTNVALITPTRYYADRTLTNNASYRYRVRATDREGNVSGWRYSQTFKPAVFQETSGLATYTGAWLTYKTTGALGGTVKYTPTLGKKVAFTYTIYDIALVMTKTASSGSADVYIDGVLSTRINLRASKTTYRQLVYTKHFASLAAHTIEIRPIGTGRVDIDGFAVLR